MERKRNIVKVKVHFLIIIIIIIGELLFSGILLSRLPEK